MVIGPLRVTLENCSSMVAPVMFFCGVEYLKQV